MTKTIDFKPVHFKPREVSVPGVIVKTMSQFIVFLRGHNLSDNTLIAYQTDLEQLAGFLLSRDIHHVQQVATHHLDDFITALVDGEGIKPRSAARKLATVRRFFKFCISRKIILSDPAIHTEKVRFSFTPAIAPTEDVLLSLIENIPANTTIGLRDRAMFRLLYDAGLRRATLRELDVFNEKNPPDCTVWPNLVVTFTNKGGNNENNPINETTKRYVDEWLEVRQHFTRNKSCNALFLSNRGTRLTSNAIHDRLKIYAKKEGVPHMHMHLFRHGRARHIIDKLGLQAAQGFLKHSDIRTTANIYGLQDTAKVRQKLRDECELGTEAAA